MRNFYFWSVKENAPWELAQQAAQQQQQQQKQRVMEMMASMGAPMPPGGIKQEDLFKTPQLPVQGMYSIPWYD